MDRLFLLPEGAETMKFTAQDSVNEIKAYLEDMFGHMGIYKLLNWITSKVRRG